MILLPLNQEEGKRKAKASLVLIIYSMKVVASYCHVLKVNMASPSRLCNATFNIEQNGWLKLITHFWKEKIAQFLIGILRRVLDGFMQIPNLSQKVSIYRISCSWKQHLQIIIFIHRCFISYSWLLSGSSIHLWQQSHISQVKNKIPSPIIAAYNTTWIQVGVPVFSFFLSDCVLSHTSVSHELLSFQSRETLASFCSNWLHFHYFGSQVS